jgi:flagellar hook-associated protein 1 FlgK
VDLLTSKAIRSGEIAAYVEMRDDILVKAQAQLDELAATLARALSDSTVPGVAVSVGTQAGFDVDIGGLLAGNTINLTYTDSSNVQHRITLVRVDDPSVLPLPSTHTPDPDDDVIGIDFSGGMASVVAQLNAVLGSAGLQFSNPVGSVLRVLDDGTSNTDVEAFSATQTVPILTGGVVELPFFVDGSVPYTGAVTASGLQTVGFAGRITVNPGLISDPSRLVVFSTSPLTDAGDSTRPSFLSERLAQSAIYSPRAGIGTTEAPFVGPLTSYLRQMVSQQGNAAEAASRLSEGQQVVVNALRQRFEERASVNIDREMASLLELQTAYGANARVMTALQEMMDLLLRM